MKTLLVLLALAAFAHADPLVVTIKPATLTWRAHVPVDVVLEVANTSKAPQSIKVWLCSWGDNWKSSDPELIWSPWACDKNYERDEVLAPGASKTWTLAMHPTATARVGEHKLRLGFTAGKQPQLWSNEVVVTVANPDPIEIAIAPAKATWKVSEPVKVMVKATNVTRVKQSMKLMVCSWEDHVTTSDAALTWNKSACKKNGLGTVELEPGKSRTWTLTMFAKPDATLGAHTFRLIVTPGGGDPLSSNLATITVAK